MNLEDQVCSLELSKKLKELGVKQKSWVYWLNIRHTIHMKLNEDGSLYEDSEGYTVIDKIDYKIELGCPLSWNVAKEHTWSAFTVAELGELLPTSIVDKPYPHKNMNLRMEKEFDEYIITYEANYYTSLDCSSYENMKDKNEANARAKMLIYLIENKFMEIPK